MFHKNSTFVCYFIHMKQIRMYTKNALLITLAVIVMVSVTGFSYKAHYCHGNLSGIAFYSELGIRQSISCGCADDNSTHPVSDSPVIKKNNCCSNVSFFSKLNIESPASYVSSLSLIYPVLIISLSDFTQQLAVITDFNFDTSFRSPSTQLAGRKLVLFLSQQRIPSVS